MKLPSPNDRDSWLIWMASLHPKAMDLSLDRLLPLATRLGLTQFSCPVITVAGTNGKGTVVNTLAEIYHQAGYRVGSYTSPHIWDFNERIQVQRKPVDNMLLCEAFAVIETARASCPLTYFEFTTLAALWIFQQAKLDVLVLEIGLGGRLDAVNIVEPDLAVITSIGLDHQAILGETRDAIAREKAGIIRRDKPVIIGDPDPPSELLRIAQELSQKVRCYGKEFGDAPFAVDSLVPSNLACAWEVIQILQPRLPLTFIPTLQNFSVPLRCEIQQHSPLIIFDVSHNQDSYRRLAVFLQRFPKTGKLRAVFSCYHDKIVPDLLSSLLPVIDEWWVAPLPEERGASASQLAEILQGAAVRHYDSIEFAYETAVSATKPEDQLIVFGSFAVFNQIRVRT